MVLAMNYICSLCLCPLNVSNIHLMTSTGEGNKENENHDMVPALSINTRDFILVFIWKLYTCINVTDSWTT